MRRAVGCEIRLIGPGGAGKSTVGVVLASRLGVTLVDLDRHLADRVGVISGYIGRHGYRRLVAHDRMARSR